MNAVRGDANVMINQNADREDKKADIDKSVPTPGTGFSEQSKENVSFENAAKSGCENRVPGRWSKICRPAGYCWEEG